VAASLGSFRLPSFIESVISSPKTPRDKDKPPKSPPPVTPRTPSARSKSMEGSDPADTQDLNGEEEDEFDDEYHCELTVDHESRRYVAGSNIVLFPHAPAASLFPIFFTELQKRMRSILGDVRRN